jgi:PAS domain S-box-containing protein
MQDIGDQKRAEAALRQSERRLTEVLESVSDGFFALAPDWRFTVFNRACEVAFAANRDAVLGNTIWDVFPATCHTEFESRLRAVAQTRQSDNFETSLIAGPGRTIEVRAAPKDAGGVAVAFSEITERKRAEEHRQLLVNELNHRVKNTLSVVQAIAAQSFKVGMGTELARSAFDGRLTTLAAAHTLLTAHNWEKAGLVELIESAIVVCAERTRFTVDGPAIALPPQTAVSMALALHELCTNAIKYGALSVPSGRVTITWRIEAAPDGDRRLRLLWAETGGPPVTMPATRGFGSRLLERGLARELNGVVELDFAPDGLQCRIDAPLPLDL